MTKYRRFSETSASSLQIPSYNELSNEHGRHGRRGSFSFHLQWKLVKLLLPNSKFRLGWEVFIFLSIWYNSVMTPIRLFILSGDKTPPALISIDIALDFIFVIDALLLFYRPYIDKDTGRMVTNLQQIRSKYLASATFYLNIIACIPILKGPISPLFDEETNLVLSTNFNVLRMIRILHFQSQFRDLKMFLSQKGPVNDSVFRMGIILFFTQLFMCILGSVYFGSATVKVDDICPGSEYFVEEVLGTNMWIAEDPIITNVMNPDTCANRCDDCPQPIFFARSVYFLMQTLFTIGYGDSVVPSKSNLELILVCLFMLFGVFGFGLIIANMTSVLSNIDVVSMRFRHEMDDINKWLSLRSVPQSLREKVELYFSYLARTQHGMLDDALFADLPPQLKKELNDIAINSLTKIPFFKMQYREMVFLSRVSQALIRRIYPPGSVLLYEGEKQREMIIVKIGRVNLHVRGSQQPVGTLLPGDYIGDYQLLFGTVNQVGASASEFSEVLALTFSRFEQVMDQDIEFRSLGGNFRQSNDPGALETVENAKKFLDKVAKNMKNLSKQEYSKKIQNMLRENEIKTKSFYILPSSPLHVYWDIFSLIAIMYYSLSSPIRFALFFRKNELQSARDHLFFVDYTVDFIFILDLILRLQFYAFIDFDNGRNEIVADRAMIKKKYVQSDWFKIDRIAIIPFDLLSQLYGYPTLLRIPKLVRVFQIPSIIKRLQRNFDDCMNISMTESQSSGLIMLIYSILMVVWSSAGWNALRNGERMYKSVYWALTTLTTVGYGDFTPNDFRETCYAIVIGAVGATFTAGIIANVTSFFHDVDISDDNIDHKLNCVKCFMDNHACTLEQTKRIQEYFNYIEREQGGLNEELLLKKSVPDHIRKTLLVHVTQSMVVNCQLFVGCEAGFLRQIMISLDQQFFGSGSMVLNPSMPADGMYFIKKGIVELVTNTASGDMKILKKLEADDNFAEECLLEHWHKNPYLAITITDCELWFLSRSKFNRLVDDFPRVRARVGSIIINKDENARRKTVHYVTKAIERAKRKTSHFIHPDSLFIQCWFGLVLIITLYSIIALPFRVAFMENHEITNTWLILDYLGDIILLFDIIIRASFLAYYDDNHLMMTQSQIWGHYLESGKMKWHIISLLPIEVALLSTSTICPLWRLQSWSLFRINKMFRLVEMGHLIQRVETSLVKVGVRVPKNAIRVGKLIMVILLSAHIVACLFFMIANFNQHSDLESPGNWAHDEGLMELSPSCPGIPVDYRTMIDRYVTALYWAMATLTTVGYGDITAHEDSIHEITFATVILIIGTAIYTMVIALLEDIVSQLDVTSSLHKMRMDKVTKYVQSKGLPDNIKSKIEAYYENIWKSQRGVKGQQLLKFFPSSFRTEMTLDMISSLLHGTFFIKDCTADFIAHIIDALSFEVYLPDDTVFHEGERCSSLFFLYKGEIDLLTSKNVKFKTVSNCVLGDSSFFGLEPHVCTAKTAKHCEIFILDMEDFMICLHENQLIKKYVDYLLENELQLQESKESISKMIKNLKSSKMEKMLVDREEHSVPRGIILPGALCREIWDAVALVFTIIFAFAIPFQISFSANGISLSRFCIDSSMDLFFFLDMYARIRKFATMKDGYLLTNPKEFRKVYINSEFRADMISVIPMSVVCYIMDIKDERYGMLRLFQLTRVCRFGKYLENFVETCKTRANLTISTAVMRILQIFFIVLFLCHWVACIYHFIGTSSSSTTTWLVADDSVKESMITRYVRSFYWSLYTVTTIGYGSVPVITNVERVFAMFVMAAGAVICDAGITAILTSIISIRDQQAGANRRRIQCCKRFMKTYMISDHLQERVLNFYNYNDIELANMNEIEILSDLSVNIRSEVLHFFCFEPLKESYLVDGFNEGAVRSLVQMMNPYLAIPEESLSIEGEKSNSIFVLTSGMMVSRDSSGYEALMPLGSIIGHTATKLLTNKNGLPAKALQISLIAAQGLKGKIANPYLIFKVGSYSCRSTVKKTKNWSEEILLKLPQNVEKCLQIIVKSWRKGKIHSTIGSINLLFGDTNSDEQKLVIKDSQGRSTGVLKLKISFRDLEKYETILNHELTTIAKGYCDLYSVKTYKFNELKQYLVSSMESDLEERLNGPLIEQYGQKGLSDKERVRNCWRRPSRPNLHTPQQTTKRSLLVSREAVQRKRSLEKKKNEKWSVVKVEHNNIQKETKRKKKSFLSVIRAKRFATVQPESDREDALSGAKEHRQNWIGSNKVKTGTLSSQKENEICTSEEEESQELIEELSEREESWDILVDIHHDDESKPSRRATLYIDWDSTMK